MTRFSALRLLVVMLAGLVVFSGCSSGQATTNPTLSSIPSNDSGTPAAASSAGDHPTLVLEPTFAGIRVEPKPQWNVNIAGRKFISQVDSDSVIVTTQAEEGEPPPAWTMAMIGLTDGQTKWSISDRQMSFYSVSGLDSILTISYPLGDLSAPGKVQSLDSQSGKVRWEHPLARSASATVVGKTIVLQWNSDPLTGIEVLSAQDGTSLWSKSTGHWFINNFDKGSELLYELDGNILRVVNSVDGQTLAETGTEPVQSPTVNVNGLIVQDDQPTVILRYTDGFTSTFTVHTLTPLWSRTLAKQTQVVSDTQYLLTKNADDYTRLDALTGQQEWTHRISGDFLNGSAVISTPGLVYLYGVTVGDTVEVDAVDPVTGATHWQASLPAVNSVELIPTDDVLYLHRQLDAPGTQWQLTALDSRTGQQLWSIDVPYVTGGSPLPVENGLIITDTAGVTLLR